MNKVYAVASAAMIVALTVALTIHVRADDKVIHDFMEKTHKGKDSPVQQVVAGKADEKLLKEFLAGYQAMAAAKPPKGDEAAWKKKCEALVAATQGLIDKKPDAAAAFKAAVDCKACHSEHKPQKQK